MRLFPPALLPITVTHTQCYQLGNQGIDMGVFGVPVGRREFLTGCNYREVDDVEDGIVTFKNIFSSTPLSRF